MSTGDSQRDPSSPLGATIRANSDTVRRMKKQKGFLRELGLSVPVTAEDVKQAYRERAKVAHPDRQGGDVEQFLKLQDAFDEALQYAERNGKRLPWIGTQMPAYIAQRDAMDLITKWGGTFDIASYDWLAETVGSDFALLANRLIMIDLSGLAIGDAELVELAADPEGVRNVELLFLAGTQVTDDGILEITAMRNLRYVDLRDTKVSTAMRKQIARLERIDRVEGIPSGWWSKLMGR